MLRIRSWPGVANFFCKLQARRVPQPVLLNHFFKLRAEHIHLASGVIPHAGSSIGLDRVATESDVKPISLFTFDDKVTARKILRVWFIFSSLRDHVD